MSRPTRTRYRCSILSGNSSRSVNLQYLSLGSFRRIRGPYPSDSPRFRLRSCVHTLILEPHWLVEMMELPQALTLTLTLPRSIAARSMSPAHFTLSQVPVRRRVRRLFYAFSVLVLFRLQHPWLKFRVWSAFFYRYSSTTSDVVFKQSRSFRDDFSSSLDNLRIGRRCKEQVVFGPMS